MDIKHRLLSDHGVDIAKSTVPGLVSLVHNTVRDLRLGLQDPRQYRSFGQLLAARDHRLDRVGETVDAVEDQRFVPNNVRFVHGNLGDRHCLFIADFSWWVANEPEIDKWMDCNLRDGSHSRNGMIVELADAEELMLFLLSWQGAHSRCRS